MKPSRVVFPGFWFGQSDLKQAEQLAKQGVGGFCVYGATAQEMLDFSRRMNEISPYGRLLFCADIAEDLSEIIKDAPSLPGNHTLFNSKTTDAAYRKGNLLGRLARAAGIDWVLAPVVDLGYKSPSLSEDPMTVVRLAGDMTAGLSNAGALSCIKYFPGISGALKTLPQLEDAEFVPYKNLFRRSDAVMPSDMSFPNLDDNAQAMLSDKVIKGLLRKRLNYKGCIVSFPLNRAKVRYEEASAIKMLHAGVEIILAPRNATGVIEAVTHEINRGLLTDAITQTISDIEMFISKVSSGPEPDTFDKACELARKAFE